jgi:hypothetical protein
MRLFLLAVAVVALPGLAIADTITFTAPTITLTESNSVQTGYFDVTISDAASSNSNLNAGGTTGTTAGTDSVTSDTVELTSQGGNGAVVGTTITFPNSDDLTSAATVGGNYTYLFAPSNSADDPSNNGSNVNYQTNNQDVWLNDAAEGAGASLAAGTPLGLLRVEYSIPANYTGSVDLTLQAPTNGQEGWGDSSFSFNTPLTVNGSITVNSAITPEPSSLVLLLFGAIGLFGIRRLRARG